MFRFNLAAVRSYRRRDGRPVGGGKFRVRIAA
jgi:hypothetical protein